MKYLLIVMLSMLLFFTPACKNKNHGTPSTAQAAKNQPYSNIIAGTTHIYNTITPLAGTITPQLELVKELTYRNIDPETVSFFDEAAKDDHNNLFLLDGRATKIYKFNSQGRYEKSFLQKGEGPGELRKPVLTFKVSGNNVWASFVTEFCRFDTDGHAIEKKYFKKQYGLLEHIDEKRFITSYDTYNGAEKTGAICAIMDTDENQIMPLFEKKNPNIGFSVLKVSDKNFPFVSATSPRLGYAYNPTNAVIYGYYNFTYSIWLMGVDGKVQKMVHKKHEPVEIKSDEIDRILAGLKRMGWPPEYLDAYKKNPPEKFLPAISKICLLPKAYFGVIRSVNYDLEELDVFNAEGQLVYTLKSCPEIPYLRDVFFFRDSIGVIIHEDEMDIYKEYKIKNLPQIY